MNSLLARERRTCVGTRLSASARMACRRGAEGWSKEARYPRSLDMPTFAPHACLPTTNSYTRLWVDYGHSLPFVICYCDVMRHVMQGYLESQLLFRPVLPAPCVCLIVHYRWDKLVSGIRGAFPQRKSKFPLRMSSTKTEIRHPKPRCSPFSW